MTTRQIRLNSSSRADESFVFEVTLPFNNSMSTVTSPIHPSLSFYVVLEIMYIELHSGEPTQLQSLIISQFV